MSKPVDWLPHRREDVLTMSRTWISVFTEETTDSKGQTVKKYVAWGIPAETFAEYGNLYSKAQETLTAAKEKETRTEVVNAACRAAFAALVEAMRNIKRRWLLSPPLTVEDLIALNLKVRDKKPTASGAPTARVLPEIIGRGQGSFKLRFSYVEGSANDSANKSRRLYYKILEPNAPPPATPEELVKSEPMNRINETLRLEYGDSGKTIFMAVQLENGDFKGPFGPMVSAVIP